MRLDAFVVMPNHVHGIIQITPNENGSPRVNPDSAGTLHATCLQNDGGDRMFEISPKSGSLSAIIRSYKSALTRWCNHKNYEFGWQGRFYDHIVRNEESLNRIREYIEYNPENWEEDLNNIF